MTAHPPDADDLAFAAEINAALEGRARVDLFSIERPEGGRDYRLVMSCRGMRRTISSETAFCFAGVTDIVQRVNTWLATMDNPSSRWTDDPAYA